MAESKIEHLSLLLISILKSESAKSDLEHFIIKKDPTVKTALELLIENSNKTQYLVRFAVEENGKLIARSGIYHNLIYATSKESTLKELQKIAEQLQKIYSLPYTPRIFNDGTLV